VLIWRKIGAIVLHLEAGVLMVLARLLVAYVPMRHWCGSLGRRQDVETPAIALTAPQRKRAGRVVRAVQRVARISPADFACLPKSMATQWMLRRRRVASRLVFGVGRDLQENGERPLHAWIEVEGRETPAASSAAKYARGLNLQTEF